MSRLRTMSVSMSTPMATVRPTCWSTCSGATIMAANVPARMMPAEVMTVPVRAEAMVMPERRSRPALSSRTRLMRKML